MRPHFRPITTSRNWTPFPNSTTSYKTTTLWSSSNSGSNLKSIRNSKLTLRWWTKKHKIINQNHLKLLILKTCWRSQGKITDLLFRKLKGFKQPYLGKREILTKWGISWSMGSPVVASVLDFHIIIVGKVEVLPQVTFRVKLKRLLCNSNYCLKLIMTNWNGEKILIPWSDSQPDLWILWDSYKKPFIQDKAPATTQFKVKRWHSKQTRKSSKALCEK